MGLFYLSYFKILPPLIMDVCLLGTRMVCLFFHAYTLFNHVTPTTSDEFFTRQRKGIFIIGKIIFLNIFLMF
jgi:hypothetical protein